MHAAGGGYAEYTAYRDIIMNLTSERASEAGISRRALSYYKERLKKGMLIRLQERTKKKLRGLK